MDHLHDSGEFLLLENSDALQMCMQLWIFNHDVQWKYKG